MHFSGATLDSHQHHRQQTVAKGVNLNVGAISHKLLMVHQSQVLGSQGPTLIPAMQGESVGTPQRSLV